MNDTTTIYWEDGTIILVIIEAATVQYTSTQAMTPRQVAAQPAAASAKETWARPHRGAVAKTSCSSGFRIVLRLVDMNICMYICIYDYMYICMYV